MGRRALTMSPIRAALISVIGLPERCSSNWVEVAAIARLGGFTFRSAQSLRFIRRGAELLEFTGYCSIDGRFPTLVFVLGQLIEPQDVQTRSAGLRCEAVASFENATAEIG
jgi:hypothetical protein